MMNAFQITFEDRSTQRCNRERWPWDVSRRIDTESAAQERVTYCSLKRKRRIILGLLELKMSAHLVHHCQGATGSGQVFLVQMQYLPHFFVHVLLQIC
ncbi:hypothetical protein GOC80_11980 [Sinorhizobium medicae]|nr:hypothetical protein [Sinorhizobium medicae]